MLNIFVVLIISYIVSLVLTAVVAIILNTFYKTEIDFYRMMQISNAGLGVSIMLSFMASMVILQLNVNAEEKTIYLFIVFIIGYLLTIFSSLLSHLYFKIKALNIENK
jgi:hypothetical protein